MSPAGPHTSRSTAHWLLEGLVELGIDAIYANLGTDHVSLIEAIAERDRAGLPRPRVVLCPHENLAVHMASGHAAATGRGQVVLVHVDAGTANAAMGLHNVARRRQPLLLLAGRAPFTLHGELPGARDHVVHYLQDPFDLRGLVRPYVRWEYDLSTGVNVKEVLRRAHSVAHSAPAGPVFLTLPREVLAQSWPAHAIGRYDADRYGAIAPGGADPAQVAAIAKRLLASERPVAVTSYLGRDPAAVHQLESLAREAGIRVVEASPSELNLSRASPCHAGFDPAPVADADFVLLLDTDVPWLPQQLPDGPRCYVAHVDVDPIKRDFPMWGFATHARLAGDCAVVLRQLRDAFADQLAPATRARIAARVAGWAEHDARTRAAWAAAATRAGEEGAVGLDFACAAIGRRLDADDIVVNEAVRSARPVLTQIPRTRPRTYFGASGGGLGFGAGMALGAKLACPRRRVVHFVGDGSFQFGNPDAAQSVAAQYRLPVLTVILDNGGWAAVRNATELVHPGGAAAAAGDFQSRIGGPERRLEAVAAGFGAHAEAVTAPEQLASALDRAFAALESGRAAVLRIALAPAQ